jgi:phage terminase large subunit GpA-like protein
VTRLTRIFSLKDARFTPDTIPDGVLVLTAGVDVQADRLECLVVGHSHADELYFIDQRIFYGSPANLQVWDELG